MGPPVCRHTFQRSRHGGISQECGQFAGLFVVRDSFLLRCPNDCSQRQCYSWLTCDFSGGSQDEYAVAPRKKFRPDVGLFRTLRNRETPDLLPIIDTASQPRVAQRKLCPGSLYYLWRNVASINKISFLTSRSRILLGSQEASTNTRTV